jgi:signal transduction histidine kinase
VAGLTIAAGVALGIAGLATAFGGSQRIGGLALLAGLLWFAPVWVGWQQGPLLVRSIGMATAGLLLPVLVHVLLAHPSGRLTGTSARAVAVAAYAGAILVSVAGALFRNPFYDPDCWANCTDNVFVLRPLPDVARAVVLTELWFTVTVAVAVAALCTRRVATASPPARRILLPVAAPAVVLMAAAAARALTLVRRPLEDPADPVLRYAFILQCTASVALATGLVWSLVRARVQQRAVSRIASNLGDAPAPGSLEAALGRAVGDPALRIAYWLPGSARYVDASGQPVAAPEVGPGRAVTALVRGDQRVAVVSHARGVPAIESAMGAAYTLALDNERLQAEGLAQLLELRASRSRIVETGDLERRRLERDLHDGAQHRLLAATYEIRLAASAAESADDLPAASVLSDALDGTLTALDDLRELANGLFPAILEEAGLEAALMSLADPAPLVVDLRGVTQERYDAAVELAAYLMVAEAVEDAAARQASRVVVEARPANGVLLVTVEDDGREPRGVLVRSSDRVGALGGTLVVGTEVGSKARRAEIPCA